MTKTTIIILSLIVAGPASAGLVWENNFNSANTFFDPSPNTVPMNDGRDEAWLGAGSVSINASSQLRLSTGGSSQTRGLVRALNPLNRLTQVDTTGDASFYRFTFDIISIGANTVLDVQFLQGIRDAGANSINTYNIDLTSGAAAELEQTATGTGAITSLFDIQYTSTNNGTTAVIEFEYNGTGDIAMVFEAKATGGPLNFTQNTVMDNMRLEVIPEPETLGLISMLGGVFFFTEQIDALVAVNGFAVCRPLSFYRDGLEKGAE